MQISELARAKINLCLHVTGQRDDGYHLLDSIVVFADIGDQITMKPSDAFSLKINGPFANGLSAGDDNLALQAARIFANDCKGAAITLTKNLPVASGIGGGSADAAATLRAMARMTGAQLPPDAGLSLGADVPVCLQSIPCRMEGIGERITPLTDFPSLWAVLVCPKAKITTPDVFAALKTKENAPIGKMANQESMGQFLQRQRNDLENPSIGGAKEIGDCLAQINQQGAFLTRMSGSGATCFGLFETRQASEKAARTLAGSNPGWWVKPCVLGA